MEKWNMLFTDIDIDIAAVISYTRGVGYHSDEN